MSIDAAEQNPVTQNAPDTGSLGAPDTTPQATQAATSQPQVSAPSTNTPAQATQVPSRDSYGDRPQLTVRAKDTPVAPINPADIKADQPKPHVSWANKINETARALVGGNPKTYTVDPNGNLVAHERPLPT